MDKVDWGMHKKRIDECTGWNRDTSLINRMKGGWRGENVWEGDYTKMCTWLVDYVDKTCVGENCATAA